MTISVDGAEKWRPMGNCRISHKFSFMIFSRTLHKVLMMLRQGYVFCYSLYENDELRFFVGHGMEQFHVSSLDFENKKSIVYSDPEINEIAHFAVNIIAYISCFPDCLTDGAPHGIKTENNHRLATSEKVVDAMETVGGVVNPHFRRGYFKRLESDFYKNKKGQIIFVHETVVNAQAKILE